MRKIETIWHRLLYDAVENKQFKHTQQEIAEYFGYSLSTVNYALKDPAAMGAVRKTGKFFVLEDFNKLLYYWASRRKLKKDVLYQTYVDAPIKEIEGLAPAKVIYGGYSAGAKILGEPPADYAQVHLYASVDQLEVLKGRYPPQGSSLENLVVLKEHPTMTEYGLVTTLPQTFVDIWNFKDWYAQDFTRALKEKIDGILS